MAHESLRFNLVLNKSVAPDSFSSFDPIYTDLRYGTHFCVYSQFSGKVVDNNYIVDSLKLRIQNFSGSVTIGLSQLIGFTDTPLGESFQVKNFSEGKKHITLYLILQAFRKPKDLIIQQGDSILKDLKFQEGDFVEIFPIFEPIPEMFNDLSQDNYTRGEKALYADDEFVIRNGETIQFRTKKSRRKSNIISDMKRNGLNQLSEKNRKLLETYEGIGGGLWCRKTISDVYLK
jgi:hypothetical protein